MSVSLNMSPTSNTLAEVIQFVNAGANVGQLAPGEAQVFSFTFDQITIIRIPPATYTQIPIATLATNPGDVTTIQAPPAGPGVDVCYASPGYQRTVNFR